MRILLLLSLLTCLYAKTLAQATDSYDLVKITDLTASLEETSGLIYTDGNLWTLNDSGAAAIYKINQSTGEVMQTVTITNATNVDWEDITADATHIYIGDFGNNANGNRTDLRVYKIRKSAITGNAIVNATAEIIDFTYNDQTDFSAKGNNNTEFDCESFFYKDGQLHLFTKDWVNVNNNGYTTRHYILPATAGTQTAVFQSEFNVEGLVTGADISVNNQGEVVLIGYESNLTDLFMWVFHNYTATDFFGGSSRKISLGKSVETTEIFNLNSTKHKGQIEGVTLTSDGKGYISSERIFRTVTSPIPYTIDIPAKLHSFSLAGWIPLPVKLLSFMATYVEPNIEIRWQTDAGADAGSFTLEHSADRVNFAPVGTVQATGNPGTVQSYNFVDNKPAGSKNYYRLKQTDANGKSAYSTIIAVAAITSVREGQKLNQLQVYPNPVGRGMLIHIQATQLCCEPVTLSLISPDGRITFQKTLQATASGSFTFPTHTIKTGLYVLQITGKNWITHRKISVY